MKTARQIAAEVKAGKLTAVEVVKASLAKIKELNPKLNAFLEVFEEEALARAADIDKKPNKGLSLLADDVVKSSILESKADFSANNFSILFSSRDKSSLTTDFIEEYSFKNFIKKLTVQGISSGCNLNNFLSNCPLTSLIIINSKKPYHLFRIL